MIRNFSQKRTTITVVKFDKLSTPTAPKVTPNADVGLVGAVGVVDAVGAVGVRKGLAKTRFFQECDYTIRLPTKPRNVKKNLLNGKN